MVTKKSTGASDSAEATTAPAAAEADTNVTEADAATDTNVTKADALADPTSKADADALRTTAAPAEVEAPMSEADAPAAVQDEDHTGKVPIKLANPIDQDEHMRRLRLPVKEGGYNVHEVVWVTPDDARALITAGLAQVDPEDKAAVRAALRGESIER